MSTQVFVLSILALAVGLPVTLAMIAEVAKRQIKFKERKLELMAEASRSRSAERDDQVDMLEERVRVLERIATDRGQDIAHQIESLRDRKPKLEDRSNA